MIASLQIYVMLFFACDPMRHYKMKKKKWLKKQQQQQWQMIVHSMLCTL